MDRGSAPPAGTKVRADQRIGVVGDTGEGREVTRGNFPPHLHLGWYDAGADGDRTVLESGAMNPYPLLVWLEEHGSAVSGGNDAASYCEAPREPIPKPSTSEDSWLTPGLPGTRPDLDTGSAYDPRPSPVVEESRQRHDRSPERGPNEQGKSGVFGGRVGAVDEGSDADPTGGSEGNDGAEEDLGGTPAPDEGEPEASEDQTSHPLAGDVSLGAKTREKSRTLQTEPPPDQTSRPSCVSILADVVLQKKKTKEEHEGRNAVQKDRDGEDRGKDREKQDKKKKQDKEKQKKRAKQLEDKEPAATESDRPKPAGGERTAKRPAR
ncbi:MAG: hypothetical protein M3N18_12490 [Actinomycetota bacterium]|nr:hypothetical protein [Actinomycetota bacterium]